MKERLDTPREFSAAAGRLLRAFVAATIAGLAVGIVVALAGIVAWQPRWLLSGIVLFGTAWAGRAWAQRWHDEAAAERRLREVWEAELQPDAAQATHLLSLLEQWEAMEEKRGSPDFDPWTLQTLRNEIREVVESDPALEQLFSRLRQVA